jgi:hypothetical protein
MTQLRALTAANQWKRGPLEELGVINLSGRFNLEFAHLFMIHHFCLTFRDFDPHVTVLAAIACVWVIFLAHLTFLVMGLVLFLWLGVTSSSRIFVDVKHHYIIIKGWATEFVGFLWVLLKDTTTATTINNDFTLLTWWFEIVFFHIWMLAIVLCEKIGLDSKILGFRKIYEFSYKIYCLLWMPENT